MHLCLFEDRAELLEPLSLTRPVFDLLCGIDRLADKQRRAFAGVTSSVGVLIRAHLENLYRVLNPDLPINDREWLASDDTLLVNGRWLPDAGMAAPKSPCVGMAQGQIAYVVLPRREAQAITFDALPDLLDHWRDTLPTVPAHGTMMNYPWDLVDRNGAQLAADFKALGLASKPSCQVTHLSLVGPRESLWIAPGAKVEPMVLADTTGGPVVIDQGAVVAAFTRLEGPCYVGPKSQVLGAKIRAGTTLGPQCRIGGEVEASIVHGFSNKYHEGFLGHSYVGECVNLGAGTHNSDLRNDYGEVTVISNGLPVRTGQNKVGCFLGDHVKTGLGTLLNTGTNVGVCCNLLPAGRLAPKYVPSFTSWWNGSLREAFTLDQLLTTAAIAMQRRGVALTPEHQAMYAWLLDDTQAERHRVLREGEQMQLRRSA